MTVTYNTINPLIWNKELRFDLSQLTIFKIQISRTENYIPYFISLLSIDEVTRSERYYVKKDQYRFIISRAITKIIAGKYTNQNANKIKIVTGFNQKPLLANIVNIHYNIAHSNDYIIIAVFGTETGVDIERIDPSFYLQDIVRQSFSLPEQVAILNSKSAQQTLFYRSWTRKEALVKATGKGIDNNFQQIPSLDGHHILPNFSQNWIVSSFMISTDYIAAIAYTAHRTDIVKAFYCIDSSLWA